MRTLLALVRLSIAIRIVSERKYMPVTVVVGGQFGSEGKGKVAYFLAKEKAASIAVRVGGPNSGHTVINESGNAMILRQIPTAALLPNVTNVLPAGSYLDLAVLFEEIAKLKLDSKRLLIDPNAVIITEKEQADEKKASLRELIGSTESGTGAAVCKRIQRGSTIRLAKDEDRLHQYISPVTSFMRSALKRGQRVIIEGTQGFGLSPLHSPYYPFATSRDTTASAFVSEAGLSPLDVDEVVLVLRTFPIRVSGNSGPLPDEIDWQTITHESTSLLPIVELTSVTRSVRRVARFNAEVVRQAIAANTPNLIVMNHLDYIDISCNEIHGLTDKSLGFIREVEQGIDAHVDYFGLGPDKLIAREHLL
jgi:adenylosuccinate synthase